MTGSRVRKRDRRIAAVCMAIMMVLSLVTGIMPVNASAALKLDEKDTVRAYGIADILSHYEHFTSGNLELQCHSVGAVIAGGKLTDTPTNQKFNSVGDGQIVPSYAYEIGNVAFSLAGGYEADSSSPNNRLYYVVQEEGTSVGWTSNKVEIIQITEDPPYVKFDEAFAQLKQESQALAQTSLSAVQEEINGSTYLVLDFTKGSDINVDYNAFLSCKKILIRGVSKDNIDKEHVANIIGVNDNAVWWGRSQTGDATLYVEEDGAIAEFRKIKKDWAENANEYLGGYSFIWNFPDATGDITIRETDGHIVAPNAAVSAVRSNFNGGIISRTTKTDDDAQAHFWPFKGTLTFPGKEAAPTGTLAITKKLNGAVDKTTFSVSVQNKETGKYYSTEGNENNGVSLASVDAGKTVTFENLPVGTYIVKESDGAEIDGFERQVTGEGETTVAEGKTTNVTITNTYTKLEEKKGKLKISKSVTGAEVSKNEFEVTVTSGGKFLKEDGTLSDTEVKLNVQTAQSLIINNVPLGTYTVKEVESSAAVAGCTYTVSVTNSGTAVIKEGEMTEINITNQYTANTGELEITKKLAGDSVTKTEFQVTIRNTKTGLYYNENGVSNATKVPLTLTIGNTLVVKNLSPGTYDVEEEDAELEGYTVAIDGAGNKEVTSDKTTKVQITNTYTRDKQAYGSIEVTKKVEGDSVTLDTFKVVIQNNATKGYLTAEGSESTTPVKIHVKAGEPLLIQNVPAGEYTVTEEDALVEGYKLTSNISGGGKITVAGNATAEVTITNHYQKENGTTAKTTAAKTTAVKPTEAPITAAPTTEVTTKVVTTAKTTAKTTEATTKAATTAKTTETKTTAKTTEATTKATTTAKTTETKTTAKTTETTTKAATTAKTTEIKTTAKTTEATTRAVTTTKTTGVSTTTKTTEATTKTVTTAVSTTSEQAVTTATEANTTTEENTTTQMVLTEFSTIAPNKSLAMGTLVLTVHDENTGEVVPNATVKVTSKDGSVTTTVVTDSKGQVVLDNATPGDYNLEVTKVPEGYEVSNGTKMATVVENQTTTKDFVVYTKDAASTAGKTTKKAATKTAQKKTEATTKVKEQPKAAATVAKTETAARAQTPAKTGDSFQPIYALFILIGSAGIAGGIYIKRKKK